MDGGRVGMDSRSGDHQVTALSAVGEAQVAAVSVCTNHRFRSFDPELCRCSINIGTTSFLRKLPIQQAPEPLFSADEYDISFRAVQMLLLHKPTTP